MAGPMEDFGFGFNNKAYSDRVLNIEVIADSLDSEGEVVEVKTLHISSLILAARSPFFQKLFENGMRESHQRDATLKINASEEAALMDVLKFMYSNTLSETSLDLVRVLIVADKFEVTSCMRYCREKLKKHMSLESALSYLKLPASVLVGDAGRPLLDAAKEFLVGRYSDFNKYQKEVMDLPLCALEVFHSGNGLRVNSEDDVFDFVLKWACGHYPKLEERREILTRLLARCICFSCMSCSKLKEVLVSQNFGHEKVSKLVVDALVSKVDNPTSKDQANTKCNSLGRIYKHRPIKVVHFELPQPRCVVYFDLKKEECENLSTSGTLRSSSFHLGGRCFYLHAQRTTKEQHTPFGLFLNMTKESESCTVDYEFAVINKSSKEFQLKGKSKCKKSNLLVGHGFVNLLRLSWIEFMSKDCVYFIDGIIHLRADITIINSQE